MSRIRMSIVAAAVAAAVIIPSNAGAASTDALQELQSLCTMKGGSWIWTPYHIARCQDSRTNKGFDREQELCSELAGFLQISDSTTRRNRSSWACFDYDPTA